jgi:hypothetical protein
MIPKKPKRYRTVETKFSTIPDTVPSGRPNPASDSTFHIPPPLFLEPLPDPDPDPPPADLFLQQYSPEGQLPGALSKPLNVAHISPLQLLPGVSEHFKANDFGLQQVWPAVPQYSPGSVVGSSKVEQLFLQDPEQLSSGSLQQAVPMYFVHSLLPSFAETLGGTHELPPVQTPPALVQSVD